MKLFAFGLHHRVVLEMSRDTETACVSDIFGDPE